MKDCIENNKVDLSAVSRCLENHRSNKHSQPYILCDTHSGHSTLIATNILEKKFLVFPRCWSVYFLPRTDRAVAGYHGSSLDGTIIRSRIVDIGLLLLLSRYEVD